MNNVNLVGRLGKDPKVFTFDSGDKKSDFSIAVDDGYWSKKDEKWIERTIWLNVSASGESKFKKGDLISIAGAKINVRSYKKDGSDEDIWITEIVARGGMRLLNRKDSNSAEPLTAENTAGTPKPKDHEDPEDDLPF